MTIRVVPANEASWEDLQAVFGPRGEAARCQCQWFKGPVTEFRAKPVDERAFRFRQQTDCGNPGAPTTSGLVAYLDGEPVGWVAVEPRTEYPKLTTMRLPWTGRTEDPSDPSVWAVTCFVVRAGHRRQGIAGALAVAAVEHARSHGARALEAYAMQAEPGVEITWGELYVGPRSVFAAAGFREVTHPTKRRYVMRIDFDE